MFLPVDQLDQVFEAMPPGVAWTQEDRALVLEHGQVRLFWDETPVDVFLSTHRFHDAAWRSARRVPLADEEIVVLDATHLTVFKTFFNRTKDWADIEAMTATDSIDAEAALAWLEELLGSDDRTCRLRSVTPPAGSR